MEMQFPFLVIDIEAMVEALGAVQTLPRKRQKEEASVETWSSASLNAVQSEREHMHRSCGLGIRDLWCYHFRRTDNNNATAPRKLWGYRPAV